MLWVAWGKKLYSWLYHRELEQNHYVLGVQKYVMNEEPNRHLAPNLETTELRILKHV